MSDLNYETPTDIESAIALLAGDDHAKVLAGGAEMELQNLLKKQFKKVINFKPKSSRSDSSEKYVVALNFKKS
mgnify:CR=1 FL=1